jgi:hypothetical protein
MRANPTAAATARHGEVSTEQQRCVLPLKSFEDRRVRGPVLNSSRAANDDPTLIDEAPNPASSLV